MLFVCFFLTFCDSKLKIFGVLDCGSKKNMAFLRGSFELWGTVMRVFFLNSNIPLTELFSQLKSTGKKKSIFMTIFFCLSRNIYIYKCVARLLKDDIYHI